jgi:hypothetical protein
MNGRMWTSLVGACLLLLTCASQAQKITWKDPVGGSWNDPAKWDLNRVPAAGDSVFITAAGDYTVTMLSATVRHLTLGGAGGTPELSVDVKGGGWLTVSDTLFNSGTLIMTASNLVSGQGGIAVAGGALVNSGTLNISPGAGGGRTLNASLDNRGVVNVDIPLGITRLPQCTSTAGRSMYGPTSPSIRGARVPASPTVARSPWTAAEHFSSRMGSSSRIRVR